MTRRFDVVQRQAKARRKWLGLRQRARVIELLRSWKTVNLYIMQMSEAELFKALDLELKGKRRSNIITRLHQRLSSVRRNRERKSLGVR